MIRSKRLGCPADADDDDRGSIGFETADGSLLGTEEVADLDTDRRADRGAGSAGDTATRRRAARSSARTD